MGLAHLGYSSSACSAFLAKKRRELFLSHLPPLYSDTIKKNLSKSPVNLSDSLFAEDLISSAVDSTTKTSTLKSHQAMIDVASKAKGSSSYSSSPKRRSPARSPSRFRRSSPGRSPSRSPSRSSNSPKRVRFSDAKSPPPSSSSIKKKNFQQ